MCVGGLLVGVLAEIVGYRLCPSGSSVSPLVMALQGVRAIAAIVDSPYTGRWAAAAVRVVGEAEPEWPLGIARDMVLKRISHWRGYRAIPFWLGG